MPVRMSVIAVLLTSALTLAAAPAVASLDNEVAQGQKVAAQLKAGTTSCSKLSDSDFEHLGEYVMDRMIGSRAAHQAMNNRMESMMGTSRADRMHEAIGRRFADCPASGTSNGSMMRGGNWQHMSQSQWRNAANSIMGGGWMMGGTNGGGWSTGAVGVVLIALLLGGLIVFAIVRPPHRRHPGQSQPA